MSTVEIRKKNSINAYSTLETKNPYQSVLWAGIIGKTENCFFENLLASLLEKGSGYQLTKRSLALRELCLELASLDFNFRYFQSLFTHFNDPSIMTHFSYLKHLVGDLVENWSGARNMPRLICLGGVRKDLKLGDIKAMSQGLDIVKKEFLDYAPIVTNDKIVKENLVDLGFHFDQEVLTQLLSWPEFSNSISETMLVEQAQKFSSFHSISSSSEKDFALNQTCFYRFYLMRFYSCLQHIENIDSLLKNLPEGDCRVWIDHLHIPGGIFMHHKADLAAGLGYTYYCSGKIRFESFSSHFVKWLDRSKILDSKAKVAALALAVDLVQGDLCVQVD